MNANLNWLQRKIFLNNKRCWVSSAEILSNQLAVLAIDYEKIEIWNLETCTCIKAFEIPCFCFEVLHSDLLLISGICGNIYICNLDGECFLKLQENKASITRLKLLNDKLMAIAYSDGEINIWDFKKFKCSNRFKVDNYVVFALEMARNNTLLVGLLSSIKILYIDKNKSIQIIQKYKTRSLKRLNDYYFASGNENGTIQIWNLEKHECIKKIEINISPVVDLVLFSERFLISACFNGEIMIWDMVYFKCIWKFNTESFISSQNIVNNKSLLTVLLSNEQNMLDLKSNGILMSGSADHTIKIWNLNFITDFREIDREQTAILCLLKLSENRLIAGCEDGHARIYDLDNHSCIKTIKFHENSINCLKTINTEVFSSASDDGNIYFWDLNGYSRIQKIEKAHEGSILSLELVNSHLLVSGGEDNAIKLWCLETFLSVETIMIHLGAINCLKCINKDKMASGSTDKTIKIWHANDFISAQTLKGHHGAVNCMELLSPVKLISGSDDRTIKIWNLVDFSCIKTLKVHSERVMCLEIINADKIVSGSANGTVCLLDSEGSSKKLKCDFHKCINSFKVINQNELAFGDTDLYLLHLNELSSEEILSKNDEKITCLERLDSNLLASGSVDMKIKIWDIKFKFPLKTIDAHSDTVQCLKIINSQILASCSEDKSIKFWSLDTFSNIHTIEQAHEGSIYCLEVLSDTMLASAGRDDVIKLWNIEDCSVAGILRGHTSIVYCLKLINFNLLASGSGDKTIKIWNTYSKMCVFTLRAHKDSVYCLEKIGSNILVSGSADCSIKIWDLKRCVCIRTILIHDHSVRNLNVLNRNFLISGSSDETIKITKLDSSYNFKVFFNLHLHDKTVTALKII